MGRFGNDLQVTDEQRKQFMGEVRQTQKKIALLTEEARKGGKPEEIRPKVGEAPRRTSKASWRGCSRMPRKSSGRRC